MLVQTSLDRSASARRRIEALRVVNPAAADLATLLSTAVRIEPALVRRVRLLIEADVGAELDLWSSEILASASPLAISFDPACAEQLRSDLAGPAYDLLRDRVGDLIAASHAKLHWSLRLEERINQLMVSDDPAKTREAEQLLYAAIGELRAHVNDPSADPVPIARWLLAALGRIPRALAATEAGAVAELCAGAQLDRRFDPQGGRSATVEAWMPWLLATARVEMRTVPVRFPRGYLLVNQAGPGEVTLVVPGTDPMTLEVTWHNGTQAQHERLLFRIGEQVSLRIPVDEVTLETLAGERWRLVRPTHGDRSGALVRGLDFSAVRARLRPCLDRVRLLDAVVDAVARQPSSVVVLTGPAGLGKSVLLGAALDRLEDQGYLVVQHFYGVQATWDAPETVTASLQAKLRAALGPAMDAAAEPTPETPSTLSPGAVTATGPGGSDRPGSRGRRALIIANSHYEDPGLTSLSSPELDAQALAGVLGNPAVGDFDAELLVNATASDMRARVEEFLASGRRDELLLLYFSGHAIVDTKGQPYLAAVDTRTPSSSATALPTRFVQQAMTHSRSARIVLILDCDTGAEAAADAMARKDAIVEPEKFRAGQQVTVLSASNAIEDVVERPSSFAEGPSPFTRLLVEGLDSGQADLDGDGAISVEELYEYTRRRWGELAGEPRMPVLSMSASGVQGSVLLARRTDDERIAGRPHQERAAPSRVLPAATLSAAARAARAARLRGIVIALDGLPGSSAEAVDRFLREQAPIAGPLPADVSVLLSTRNGQGMRYGEAFGADAVVVEITVDDPSTEQVCRELLDWKSDELALAFGRPGDPTELIRLSGGVPGRLNTVIEWLLDQPVGTARLADLPPTLSAAADEVWNALQAQGRLQELGSIAVARPGFTMADLTATLEASAARDLGTTARLVEDLADLRLVRLDGPAVEPHTVVAVSHPSVAAAYTERFGIETTAAHGRHVRAFPYDDPSSAGPYQIANAAYHHVRYGEPEWARRLAECGSYLDLRQRSAGVDALAADLAELAALTAGYPDGNTVKLVQRAVVASLAATRAEPDRFVDLVDNALRALGATDIAEAVFRNWWRPALRVQAVHLVDPAELMWRYDVPVTAAARWSAYQIASVSADGVRLHAGASAGPLEPGPYLPQPALAVRWGDRLAVTSGGSVALTRPEAPPAPPEHLVTGAEVTSLLADGGALFAGLRDGTVIAFSSGTGGNVERRTLVGHAAAVTALARSSSGGLLSASEDGTVRVWDPPKGNLLRVYRGHKAGVVALAVLDSGAVVSGDDKGRLRWWNPETGADVGVLGGHAARVTAICALPGTTAVTAGLDGALWRWDLAVPGRPVDRLLQPPGPALLKLAVTPPDVGGAAAVVGWTGDGALTWWYPTDGTVLQTIRPDAFAESVHDLLVHESTVVVAHAAGLMAYPAPLPRPTIGAPPTTGTPPPPGTQPTTGSDPVAPGHAYLDALAHAPYRPSVAVGTGSGVMGVDLATGTSVPNGQPGLAAVSLAFTIDGGLLAVLADGSVQAARTRIGGGGRRVIAEDSATGQTVAWLQTGDGDLVELLGSPPERGEIIAGAAAETTAVAAASIDRRWVAAGDAAGVVRLIRPADVPEMDLVRTGGGAVTALAFAHSGRWLVTGSADGGIRRMDLSAPHAVSLVGRHAAAVTGLAIVADTDAPRDQRDRRDIHDRVVSGSADGTLRLWDLETGRLLGVAAGQVGFRAAASSGRTVTARDAEGRLWVLEADPYIRTPSAADRLTVSGVRTGWDDVGPREVEGRFEFEVLASAAVELRAARILTEPPLRPALRQRPRLLMDDVTLVVDETGRLAVPRRLPPGRRLRVAVRQQLRTTVSAEAPRPSLRLTLYSPESGEGEVIFRDRS